MINRLSVSLSLSVNTATGTTDELKFGEFSMGELHVPAGSSLTTLTWYSAATEGGTYLASNDEDGVAITQAVAAGKAYQMPLALAGARFLKPVGNVAEEVAFVLKG